MTEHPPRDDTPRPESSTPADELNTPRSDTAPATIKSTVRQPFSRWDKIRPRGRIGQVAVILVAAAATIVIVGSIFVAGFALGSDGEEHHDWDGYGQSNTEHRGDGERSGSGGHDHQDGSEALLRRQPTR